MRGVRREVRRRGRIEAGILAAKMRQTQLKANKNTEFRKHSDLERDLKSCENFFKGVK